MLNKIMIQIIDLCNVQLEILVGIKIGRFYFACILGEAICFQ